MEQANHKAASAGDSLPSTDKGVDDITRVNLVAEFLQSARTLDKDGSGTISRADGKAATVTGRNTEWFSESLDSVLLYKDQLDPNPDFTVKLPAQVTVQSLIDSQKESKNVLSNLNKSRNTTSELGDNFESIDLNADGFLDQLEATKANKSGKLSNASRNYLSTQFDSIESASNDEWGTENNGITRDDIKAFEYDRESAPKNIFFDGLADHVAGKPALIDELLDNQYIPMDLDSDGALSRNEMQFAINDKQSPLSADEKALVQLLLDHDDVFEFKHGPVNDTEPLVSIADLEEFSDAVEGRTFDQEDLLAQYRTSNLYGSYRNSITEWATGAGILAGGSAGSAIGFFSAGPGGVAPGLPVGILSGGIAGGLAGAYGGGRALDHMFRRSYSEVRLPALVSFREQYKELREKK